MTTQKPMAYGGQAVIEGVMFSGKKITVTAIRRKDQTIEYFHEERKQKPILQKLKKIPLIRGIVGLIEASATGSKHLNFSSERYDIEPGDEEAETKEEEKSAWNIIHDSRGCGGRGPFLCLWKVNLHYCARSLS